MLFVWNRLIRPTLACQRCVVVARTKRISTSLVFISGLNKAVTAQAVDSLCVGRSFKKDTFSVTKLWLSMSKGKLQTTFGLLKDSPSLCELEIPQISVVFLLMPVVIVEDGDNNFYNEYIVKI